MTEDIIKELSAKLEDCYYLASKNGLGRVARAIDTAELVLIEESERIV